MEIFPCVISLDIMSKPLVALMMLLLFLLLLFCVTLAVQVMIGVFHLAERPLRRSF